MPTYVYKFVKTGETIEVQQSFQEPTLTALVHPQSGRKMAVKKVFTPVGVTFRGDGFYKTDSREKKSGKAAPKVESTNGDASADSSKTSTPTDGAKSDKSDKTTTPTKKSSADSTAASTP